VAAGRARATGEETVRGRVSGATIEENGEGGGEACLVDGEVCLGDGEGACSGDRRGDGEGRASDSIGEENVEGGGEACSGDGGEAQATTTRRARALRQATLCISGFRSREE
jgi:hypothetical protein